MRRWPHSYQSTHSKSPKTSDLTHTHSHWHNSPSHLSHRSRSLTSLPHSVRLCVFWFDSRVSCKMHWRSCLHWRRRLVWPPMPSPPTKWPSPSSTSCTHNTSTHYSTLTSHYCPNGVHNCRKYKRHSSHTPSHTSPHCPTNPPDDN